MIKIGLFGYGHLGKIHQKCLSETPFDLIGFHDPAISGGLDTIQYYDHQDALMEVCDACIIASTTTSHYDLIVKAIANGKHFFVEKPMTSTVEEAKHIDKLLIENPDIISQVGFVERYNPAYTFVESAIDKPRFIEVHRLASFNPRGNDVSVVLDLMIHDLDLVLGMIPSKVKEIKANGLKLISDSLDLCNVRLEFEDRSVANLTASRMSLKMMRKFRVFQENAYISLDLDERKAQIVNLSDTEMKDAMKLEFNGKEKFLQISTSGKLEGNAIVEELKDFHKSITHNIQPRTNCRAALRTSIVADKIERIANESSVI